jgi:hypothetical protein
MEKESINLLEICKTNLLTKSPLFKNLPPLYIIKEQFNTETLNLLYSYLQKKINILQEEDAEISQSFKKRAKLDSDYSKFDRAIFGEHVEKFTSIDITNNVNRNAIYTLKTCRYYNSTVSIPSKIRNLLFENCVSLDIENCQYSLLYCYLSRFYPSFIPHIPFIDTYCKNRDFFYNQLKDEILKLSGEELHYSQYKEIFNSLIGEISSGLEIWKEKLKISLLPEIILNVQNEIKTVINLLQDPMFESFGEKPRFGSLSKFLQLLETWNMLTLIECLKLEGIQTNCWIYDGLEISSSMTDYNWKELYEDLKYSLKLHGFYTETIKFTIIPPKEKTKTPEFKWIKSLIASHLAETTLNKKSTELCEKLNSVTTQIGIYSKYEKSLLTFEEALDIFNIEYSPFKTLSSTKIYTKAGKEWAEFKQHDFIDMYCPIKVLKIGKDNQFSKLLVKSGKIPVYSSVGYFIDNSACPENVKNLHPGLEISNVKLSQFDCNNEFYTNLRDFFIDHIKNQLCNSDFKTYDILIKFIAHMFQYPQTLPRVFIVLYSKIQGTGKSQLLNILGKIIGDYSFCITSNPKFVLGEFNKIVAGKLLIGLDESCIQKAEYLNNLKAFVTEPQITVSGKNLNAFKTNNITKATAFCNIKISSICSFVWNIGVSPCTDPVKYI